MKSIYAVLVIGLGCLLVSGLIQASDVPDCQDDDFKKFMKPM